MALAKLLYEAGIDVKGFKIDANKIEREIRGLSETADKFFQREIGRSLANAIDPDIPAQKLLILKKKIQAFGKEAQQSFEKTFSRRQARRIMTPFVSEAETFAGRIKSAFAGAFSIKNLAIGFAAGFGLITSIRAISQALKDLAKTSFNSAIDFELNMNRVRSIAESTFIKPAIERQIKRLATRVPQDLEDLSKALFLTITSGVRDVTKAVKTLGVASKAAVAGLTNTTTAVDSLTTVLNAYQLGAEKAGEVSDVLFRIVDQGKVFFEQLNGVLGDVANPAAVASVNLRDLGAAIAVMTKAGIDAEQTATGIRSFLIELSKPAPKVRKFAKSLGVDLSVAGLKAAGGLVPFIDKIHKVTKGSSEMLAQFVSNRRSLRFLTVAAGTGADEFQRLGKAFRDDAFIFGTTQRVFDRVSDSLKVQIKLLRDATKVRLINLGNKIAALVKPFVKFGLLLLDMRTSTEKFVDSLEKISVVSDKLAIGKLSDDIAKLIDSLKLTPVEKRQLVFFDVQAQISILRKSIADLNKQLTKDLKSNLKTIEFIGSKTISEPIRKQINDIISNAEATSEEKLSGLIKVNARVAKIVADLADKLQQGLIRGDISKKQQQHVEDLVDAWAKVNEKLRNDIDLQAQIIRAEQQIKKEQDRLKKAETDINKAREEGKALTTSDIELMKQRAKEARQLSEILRLSVRDLISQQKTLDISAFGNIAFEFSDRKRRINELTSLEESKREEALKRLSLIEEQLLKQAIDRASDNAVKFIEKSAGDVIEIGVIKSRALLQQEFEARRRQIKNLVDIEGEFRQRMLDSLNKAEAASIEKMMLSVLDALNKEIQKKPLRQTIDIGKIKLSAEADTEQFTRNVNEAGQSIKKLSDDSDT
ncbi:phage tail tape measure protein, partial [Candidatus Parcubacteria bacterium]